jgi:hypothetical protein
MALPRPLPPAARVRELLDYDPNTGRFTWRAGPKSGTTAGSIGGRYVQIMIGKKNYLAHRLAWLYARGSPPSDEIDHVNGNPRDNRIDNLRLASKSQNAQNQRRSTKNSSGFKGVSWSKQKQRWRAVIKVGSRSVHLGYFRDVAAAAEAYRAAADKYFGDFARAA